MGRSEDVNDKRRKSKGRWATVIVPVNDECVSIQNVKVTTSAGESLHLKSAVLAKRKKNMWLSQHCTARSNAL